MGEWWHASDVLHGTLGHRTEHPDVPPCVTFLSQRIARDAAGVQSANDLANDLPGLCLDTLIDGPQTGA